jgi:hypothetical protein
LSLLHFFVAASLTEQPPIVATATNSANIH